MRFSSNNLLMWTSQQKRPWRAAKTTAALDWLWLTGTSFLDLSLLDNDTSWWFQRLWNICQNGNFPQVGAKIRNIRSHHLGYFYCQTKAHTAHSSTCTSGASVHLQVVDSCATPQIQIAPNWMLDMPYTLGPQNHERWRFYTHKIWVIAPKNEGCGLWWYYLYFSLSKKNTLLVVL